MTTAQMQKPAPERAQEKVPEDMPKARDDARDILGITDALLDEIDEVIEEAPPAPPLTLGDLIRKGAALAPQAIGAWQTPAGETCALQAAYEAAKAEGLVS